jgi:L-seryl-tRNA(Ser) seleniumtransferase
VLQTWLIAVGVDGLSADELMARLRRANPPTIARVQEDRVVLDLRTVFPEQEEKVVAALASVAAR